MSNAKFSINGDTSDAGYDAALGATLTLRPKASPGTDIRTYTFEVVVKYSASPDLPELPEGTPVALTPTPLTPLDVSFPAAGPILVYKIRGQINGGTRRVAGPDGRPVTEVVPEWTHERIVLYRLGTGQRPIVPTERFEYDPVDGWASAVNDMIGTWGGGAVVGPAASTIDAVATWSNVLGGTLQDNPLVKVSAGKLRLGSNPPSGDAINLSNAQGIYWETVAPSAGDVRALTVDASNDLILGDNDANLGDVSVQTKSGQSVTVAIGGITKLTVGGSLTSTPNNLAIGSSPAGSGTVRLPQGFSIRANNLAGTNIIPVLATDGTDKLLIGGNFVQTGGVAIDARTGKTIEAKVGGTPELTVQGLKVLVANELEVDGTLNHDGASLGFRGVAPVAISQAYTVSNGVTDRSYDANATTIHELADVLGTIIGDLQAQGLLG